MNEKEMVTLWKSYDQKLERILSLNNEMIIHMTKAKLNDTINTMRRPKQIMLFIGIPYTLLLYFLSFIGYQAGGFFVSIGFGMIGLIMTGVIIGYIYHLHLINQIKRSQDIIAVQTKIAQLKISSFNIARLVVLQLPFWSICWMSLDALKASPLIYGGINAIVFIGLSYIAFWLYKEMSITGDSKVSRIFFSGMEWDPILKASKILDQIKEYQK